MSFQKKLNFVFLNLILLPILVVASGIIFFSMRALMNNSIALGAATFRQLESNLVHKLDSYLSVTDWMMAESELIGALQQDYRSYAQYFDNYFGPIRAAATKAQRMNADPIDVSVYASNPGVVPDYRFVFPAGEDVQASAWYQGILAGYGSNTIYLDQADGETSLLLGRLLNPFAKPQRQAVLVVRVPEDSLFSLFSDEGSYRSIYLVDDQGTIACSNERQSVGQPASSVTGLEALIQLGDAHEGRLRSGSVAYAAVLGGEGPFAGWRLVSLQSGQRLLDDLMGILGWGVVFFLTLAAVAFCFLFIFSKRMTGRLRGLAAEMEQAGTLDFAPASPDGSQDEIGVLSRTFQEMLQRIEALIQEVYVDKLSIQQLKVREQEAELNALQSQINPHFLFNVLECISASLVKRQDDEALELVERFAFLMRRATDLTRGKITLDEEIQMIEAYMSIQSFRFRDRLKLQVEVPPGLRKQLIPKFSLHPLVENAVTHGLRAKDGPGTVRVTVCEREGVLTATVADDGVGMEGERLHQVREGLAGEQPAGASIGLNNIHQRARLYYGEDYGLELESAPSLGTRVTLRLPTGDEG